MHMAPLASSSRDRRVAGLRLQCAKWCRTIR